MIRFKCPIEYELSPGTIEKGTHWLSVRLKNTGDDHLKNLNIKMHSLDLVHISFRNPNHYIYNLEPDEEKYFEVEVEAYCILVFVDAGMEDHFHWDSGLMREHVLGDPAEIERVFVSSPYSNIDGELEVEAVVKGLSDSNGLGLAFWAETPSGKFEELADMKTRKMSRGDETAYKAKLKPKEDGYYTVYVNLYDDYRNIARAYDTLYVAKI
jgi:hypothetical protein